LGLVFTVDRAAKTLTAQHGWASGYNLGQHRIDASKLTFDGTNVVGACLVIARARSARVTLPPAGH
jgi:hypothetical protein